VIPAAAEIEEKQGTTEKSPRFEILKISGQAVGLLGAVSHAVPGPTGRASLKSHLLLLQRHAE
jgi:hypothetical protein